MCRSIQHSLLFCFLFVVFTLLLPTPTLAAGSADLNNDKNVNIFDYNILISNFGKTGNAGFISADIDSNGIVNIFDYNGLIANFGKAIVDSNKVNIGAIYFSGSPGERTHQRNEIEGLLAFPKYKHAWPYFTVVRSDTTIDIHEDTQAVMDQEITLAATAGLDYFAFLGEGYGLKNYLSSPYKNKIKFAFMGGIDAIVNNNIANNMVTYAQDPQYLRVTTDARPLFYFFDPDTYLSKVDVQTTKNQLQNFSDKVKSATGKKPLLVATATNIPSATLKQLGFEDQSFYLPGTVQKGTPYNDYIQTVVSAWNRARDAGNIDIIPTASTGYDPRPKGINPLYHGFGSDPNSAQQGTPAEIASHVKAAIDWTKANPNQSHAKTVLIYAWNEFAEGGWLTPTATGNDQNQRLNQMSKFLGGTTMTPPRSPYIDNPLAPHDIGIAHITAPAANSTISGNKLTVEGTAPNATRITLQLGNQKIFFIPGKTGSRDAVPFAIEFAKPPPGNYNLKLTSPDTNSLTITNLTIK